MKAISRSKIRNGRKKGSVIFEIMIVVAIILTILVVVVCLSAGKAKITIIINCNNFTATTFFMIVIAICKKTHRS